VLATHCKHPVIIASKILDNVQSFPYTFTHPLMCISVLVDELEIPGLKDANVMVDIEAFWKQIELSIILATNRTLDNASRTNKRYLYKPFSFPLRSMRLKIFSSQVQ